MLALRQVTCICLWMVLCRVLEKLLSNPGKLLVILSTVSSTYKLCVSLYRAIFADIMFINEHFQIETLQRAQTMKSLSEASNRQLLVSLVTITKTRLYIFYPLSWWSTSVNKDLEWNIPLYRPSTWLIRIIQPRYDNYRYMLHHSVLLFSITYSTLIITIIIIVVVIIIIIDANL